MLCASVFGLVPAVGAGPGLGGHEISTIASQMQRPKQQSWTGSDTVPGDLFGGSVAISGTTIVVGAPWHASQAGRVYVFSEAGSSWHQVAELKGSDTTAHDNFGNSVAISGTTVVVGSPYASGDGRAYIFNKTQTGWHQVKELAGNDASSNDGFRSVG